MEELNEKLLIYPLSNPLINQNELMLADKVTAENYYYDDVKISDFFSNRRELDHFINHYKFSLKLMSNKGENIYFDKQSYYVYKLITYKYSWIDIFLQFLYNKKYTISQNIEGDILPKIQSDILNIEEIQLYNIRTFIEDKNIIIEEDEKILIINCLKYLFLNNFKYGLKNGAMYRMYNTDNVLTNKSYFSIFNNIYSGIIKNKIDLSSFFQKEFFNSNLNLDEYNKKILQEFLYVSYNFTSIPEELYTDYLDELIKIRDLINENTKNFIFDFDNKMVQLNISFYKLNNGEKNYKNLYKWIQGKILFNVFNQNDQIDLINSIITFLNFGLGKNEKQFIIKELNIKKLNIFHNAISSFYQEKNKLDIYINIKDNSNSKIKISKLSLNLNEIEEIFLNILKIEGSVIEKNDIYVNYLSFRYTKYSADYYSMTKTINENYKEFVKQNINLFFDNYEPNSEIKLSNSLYDFKTNYGLFYFKINKMREAFSFTINVNTEILLVHETINSPSSRDDFYINLYSSYLEFLNKIEKNIDIKNRKKFEYIRLIVEFQDKENNVRITNKMDKNGLFKFKSKYYSIEEFNTIRIKFGFLEYTP